MTTLRHVFVFSDRWEEVGRFYREVIGVPQESAKEDSVWFAPEGARLVIHQRDDRETAPEVRDGDGFVVWFAVEDVERAYARARAAGAVVGERYRNYFFARDPEGRYFGVHGPR